MHSWNRSLVENSIQTTVACQSILATEYTECRAYLVPVEECIHINSHLASLGRWQAAQRGVLMFSCLSRKLGGGVGNCDAIFWPNYTPAVNTPLLIASGRWLCTWTEKRPSGIYAVTNQRHPSPTYQRRAACRKHRVLRTSVGIIEIAAQERLQTGIFGMANHGDWWVQHHLLPQHSQDQQLLAMEGLRRPSSPDALRQSRSSKWRRCSAEELMAHAFTMEMIYND